MQCPHLLVNNQDLGLASPSSVRDGHAQPVTRTRSNAPAIARNANDARLEELPVTTSPGESRGHRTPRTAEFLLTRQHHW